MGRSGKLFSEFRKDKVPDMINFRKAAILFGALALLFTGCVPKGATEVARDPDFSRVKEPWLVFEQVHNDVVDAFADIEVNPYVYIRDMDISGSNEEKTIVITASALPGVSQDEADLFAAACVRRAADAVYTQFEDFEMSSKESFGGCWRYYRLRLKITGDPEDGKGDPAVLVDLDIPAGEKIPLDPDIETAEQEYVDGYRKFYEKAIFDLNGNIVNQ